MPAKPPTVIHQVLLAQELDNEGRLRFRFESEGSPSSGDIYSLLELARAHVTRRDILRDLKNN